MCVQRGRGTHLALALGYRPATFDEIVVERLSNWLAMSTEEEVAWARQG